uniref:Uncharacterized protein n=1 Tax=Rhizophora mucronata TaxID=61149 RepID=A0A2P2L058_RHIMU
MAQHSLKVIAIVLLQGAKSPGIDWSQQPKIEALDNQPKRVIKAQQALLK